MLRPNAFSYLQGRSSNKYIRFLVFLVNPDKIFDLSKVQNAFAIVAESTKVRRNRTLKLMPGHINLIQIP